MVVEVSQVSTEVSETTPKRSTGVGRDHPLPSSTTWASRKFIKFCGQTRINPVD